MTKAYEIKVTTIDTFKAFVAHYEALGFKVEAVALDNDLILKVYEAPKALPTISDDLIFEV